MKPDRPTKHTRSRLVRGQLTLLTYGLVSACGFAIATIGPAMPSLRTDLSISQTTGGLHFTALALGGLVIGSLAEQIVGRLGRRGTFWLGGAVVGMGSLLVGIGWHPGVTLAGAGAIGTGGPMLLMAALATVADRHPAHRPVVLTEVNTAMSAGSVVPSLVIGATVAVGWGWRPGFVVPVIVWAALVVRNRSVPFPVPASPQTGDRAGSLPPPYWIFWFGIIPAVATEWSMGAWGSTYLVDVAGQADGTASVLMTAFFGAMLTGRIVGGSLARSVAQLPLLLGAAGVGLSGFFLFWTSESVVPVVAGLLVAGLGISMLFPMLLSLAVDTAPGRADLASGRVFIAASCAVLLAPVTLGSIADQSGIRTAFSVVPGLFLVMAVLAIIGWKVAARHREAG